MQDLNFKLDLRWVSLGLAAIIGAMLLLWQPWEGKAKQTISVSGEALLEKAPDAFVFYPRYQATGGTAAEAQASVTATGNAVVKRLKELGIKDDDLKTDLSAYGKTVPLDSKGSSGSSAEIAPVPPRTSDNTASYGITAKVYNKELAKKVLDYLVTTSATGTITPTAEFSTETRSKLELEAREKAVADARQKAEVTAKALKSRLGRVVSVTEGTNGIKPLLEGRNATDSIQSSSPTEPVSLETGTQQIRFTVTVGFEIR